MKAFIHAGSPKCGSTAIRTWLCDHAGPLEEEGLLVLPKTTSEVSHAWMFRDFDAQFPDVARKRAIADSYDVDNERWSALQREDAARIAASNMRACILSSEFFMFARDPARLIEPIVPKDARAVVFVRSQEEAFDSAFYDLVRHPHISVDDARRLASGWTIDYPEIEDRWRAAGVDMDILPHDGNVISRFRKVIGSTSPHVPSSVVLHRTPPAAVVDYIIRRKPEHFGDPDWPAICDAFEDAYPLFEDFPRSWCLDADLRRDIRNRHAAGNREAIRRRPDLSAILDRRDNWREADFDAGNLAERCDLVYRRAYSSAKKRLPRRQAAQLAGPAAVDA